MQPLHSIDDLDQDQWELVLALQDLTRDMLAVVLDSVKSAHGLALAHCRILFALRDKGQLSGLALAREVETVPSTVSRQADRLVIEGYLSRDVDPNDRRVMLFDLTDKGNALLDEVLARRAERLARVVRKLSEAEVQRSAAVVDRIHALAYDACRGW